VATTASLGRSNGNAASAAFIRCGSAMILPR